jgi:predicted oxidoreductase
MDPGEALVALTSIVSVFIGMPWVVLSGIRKLREQKMSGRTGDGDLSAGELRSMIRDAVGEAIGPLAVRMADLEDRLGDETVDEIRARLGADALADAFDVTDDAVEPVRPARARTR